MYIGALRFPRPRHPLLRALLAVVGLALAGLLVVAGVFVFAVLAGVGAIVWLLRRAFAAPAAVGAPGTPPQRPSVPDVIEGEFVVLRDQRERGPRP